MCGMGGGAGANALNWPTICSHLILGDCVSRPRKTDTIYAMNSRDERKLFSVRDAIRATEDWHASEVHKKNRERGVLSWVAAMIIAIPLTATAIGFAAAPASVSDSRPALVASASGAFSNAAETLRDFFGRLFGNSTDAYPVAAGDGFVEVPAVLAPQPLAAIATTTPLESPSRPQTGQAIVYQTIQQPVIERVVETERVVTQGGISENALADRLNGLENKLRSLIFSQGSAQSAQTSAVYNAVAQSQRIDNLSNVTITNPTITGGSVMATAFSGTIGVSQGGTGTTSAPAYGQVLVGDGAGGYALTATSSLGITGGSGASLSDANTWTALQLFSAGASSTRFSNFGTAYFGGTATTTIDGAGNIVGAGTLSAGTTTVTNLVSTNTSTSTFVGGVQATGFNLTGSATSTAANGFNLASGCFAVNGVCIGGGGGASAWGSITGTLSDQADLQAALDARLTLTNWYATTTDALDEGSTNLYWTNIRFDNRLSATTSLPNITTLGGLSTVSTALTGFLKATAGVLSTALVDLASNVTGILPVGNGGTGWANLASGTVLLGNGSGAVSTTTRGSLTETGSSILTITGGTDALLGGGATIQVAQSSGSTSGFLSSADWTTFNSKQAALGFTPANSTRLISTTYPLQGGGDLSADRTLSLAFGTTTANTWSQAQTFSAAPIFSTLTGLLKGNGSSALTAAVAGTDYLAPITGTTGQFPYFSGTDTLSATSSLYIATSGNVGIGTTGPLAKMHISDSSDAVGSYSALRFYKGTSYGFSDFSQFYNSASDYGLNVNSGQLVVNKGSGNVGIGTTTPQSLLSVGTYGYGLGQTNAALVSSNDQQTLGLVGVGSTNINFYTSATTTRFGIIKGQADGSGSGGAFALWTSNAAGTITERMRIDSLGNVGIGTTSPLQKLSVTGTSSVVPTGSGAEGIFAITTGTGIYSDNKLEFGVHDGDYSWLQALQATSGWRNLVLQGGGGNVGIGTTNPAWKLHVHETSSNEGARLQLTNADTGVTSGDGFQILLGATEDAWVWNYENTGLHFGTNSTERMTILSGGNVGIGTTNPNEGKVEVKGGSVCVDTNSDDTASSCIANESDERLKTNITSLSASSSLAAVLALNPVAFDWRASDPEVLSHWPTLGRYASSTRSIGLIAQEVMPILPEALSLETVGDEEVQYFQLDYDKFIPLIISAMQEMWVKMQEYGEKIALIFERLQGHDERIEQLEAEVSALKSQLGGAAAASPSSTPPPPPAPSPVPAQEEQLAESGENESVEETPAEVVAPTEPEAETELVAPTSEPEEAEIPTQDAAPESPPAENTASAETPATE